MAIVAMIQVTDLVLLIGNPCNIEMEVQAWCSRPGQGGAAVCKQVRCVCGIQWFVMMICCKLAEECTNCDSV